VTRIEVVQPVAADPAGVALLLSGAAGRELWPGSSARFGPPMRSGVGFIVDLTVDAYDQPARGRVGITAGVEGPGATHLRLVISSVAPDARLRADARRFVRALAAAAQERSSAA
jgi:hypothetical protein